METLHFSAVLGFLALGLLSLAINHFIQKKIYFSNKIGMYYDSYGGSITPGVNGAFFLLCTESTHTLLVGLSLVFTI